MHKNVHIPLILSSNFYSQDYENAFARVRSDSERSAVSAHVAVDEQFRLPPSVTENVATTVAEYLVAGVQRSEEGFDTFHDSAAHHADISSVAAAHGEPCMDSQPRPYRTLQGLDTDDTPEFGKCRNYGCDEECNPQEQTCHSCRMGTSPAVLPFSGSHWVHAAEQNAQDMSSRDESHVDIPTVNAVMMDEDNAGLDAALVLAHMPLNANENAVSEVLLDSLDNLLGDFNPSTPQSE